MLPRRHRLTAPEDYRAVMRGRASTDGRRRSRAGTDLLVVHVAVPDPAADHQPSAAEKRCPRVGFAVSKGVGNSVVRHRVLRRLRVQMGVRLSRMPDGGDTVVRALAPAAGATSAQLGEALDVALAKVLRVRT